MEDAAREIIAAALYADSCGSDRDCRTWAEMKAEHKPDYEGITRFYSRADAALGALRAATQTPCPIVASVQADLSRRAAVGLAKYGVTLGRDDLSRRDWLVHTYEEVLDAACYLKKLIGMEDAP